MRGSGAGMGIGAHTRIDDSRESRAVLSPDRGEDRPALLMVNYLKGDRTAKY
jgi:hypothetical protein